MLGSLPSAESVREAIARHVVTSYPSAFTLETLPRDSSLMAAGVLDSYAVVELIAYLEETWGIAIEDGEITLEKMGSIEKMAAMVVGKLRAPAD